MVSENGVRYIETQFKLHITLENGVRWLEKRF